MHAPNPLCALHPRPGRAERKGADRMISISSREIAGSPVCAALEALALIALCLLEPKGCPPVPLIRALVPTTQVTPSTAMPSPAPPPSQIFCI